MLFTVTDDCTPGWNGGVGDWVDDHSSTTIPVVEIGGGIRSRGGGAAMTSATRASISSWVQLGDEVGVDDTNGVLKMVGGYWLTSTEDSGDGATLLSSVDQSESQVMGDVAVSRTEGFAGGATRPQRQVVFSTIS